LDVRIRPPPASCFPTKWRTRSFVLDTGRESNVARCRVDRRVLLLLTGLITSPPPTAASRASLGAASAFIPTSPLFSSSPLTSRLPLFSPSLPQCLPLLPAPAPTVSASRSSPGRPPTTVQWSLLFLTPSPTSPIVASSPDSARRDFRLERTWRSGSHPPHLSLRTSLLCSLAATSRLSYLPFLASPKSTRPGLPTTSTQTRLFLG